MPEHSTTKVLTVVGARPQFVKAAVVSREMSKRNDIEEIIIHTGQHFDENMSEIFFKEMSIPKPDYNLNVNGLSQGAMTGQMLEKIEEVLMKEKPDWVLVYGDTNSTIAGALAAKKLNIRVGHVEAGLRSHNMKMPEEINRILTDRISDILFCPTKAALSNLEKEGYLKNKDVKIVISGDVMYDAALFYSSKSHHVSSVIRKLGVDKGNFILATIHRAENTDNIERLSEIVEGFKEVCRSKKIVLPLHPRTRKVLDNYGININELSPDLLIIEPVGYFDMIELLKNCSLVMTDSGGLQKEAFFFDKYCITLRDETEWIELVDNEINYLAGASKNKILQCFNKLTNKTLPRTGQLYGDGNSAKKIVDNLLQ